MKLAYIQDWHPTEGTHYKQRLTITSAENTAYFNGIYKYGYNYTGIDGACHIAVKVKPIYGITARRILPEQLAILVMPETKAEARYAAIEWQHEFDNRTYTYGELAFWCDFWSKIGRKFGLFDEFVENGIC